MKVKERYSTFDYATYLFVSKRARIIADDVYVLYIVNKKLNFNL